MARIAHVSESLATGVLSVLAMLTHAQVRDGHEVALIGSPLRSDTPSGWREALPEGLTFIAVPMLREINPAADARGLLAIWKELRRFRPDVVHLHSSKAGALGRLAALPLGAHVVYQPHGIAYLRRDIPDRSRRAYALIERALAMLGGVVVACSDGERRALDGVVPRSRTAVVPNGVDLAGVQVADLLAPRVRVGTCGRISPQKGPRFFAEVASALRDAADFTWIGDGDEDGKAVLRSAGVEVTGWCSREEARRHIARLQIYAQTSAWEGMPVSVIEAMAAGLPIVATDIVGNHDLLAGTGAGVLVDTPRDMIDALSVLIESAERRARAGAVARSLARAKYSAANMVENFYSVYGIA